MQIDILKSPKLNLLAILNATNGTTFVADDFTVGIPIQRTPDPNPQNTSVVLTGVQTKGYMGSSLVHYMRLGMGSGVENPSFEFEVSEVTTLTNLKTTVAAALGLIASEVQITGSLPEEGDTSTVTLTAISNSLLYVGSQELELTWRGGLDTVITITDMDGFNLP